MPLSLKGKPPSASSNFTLFDQDPLIVDSTDNRLIDGIVAENSVALY